MLPYCFGHLNNVSSKDLPKLLWNYGMVTKTHESQMQETSCCNDEVGENPSNRETLGHNDQNPTSVSKSNW